MTQPHRIALLWHGDREARNTAQLEENRLRHLAQALREAGLEPEAAVYNDEFAGEVREQLLRVDGVLVWVNPFEGGRDRSALDALLKEVAGEGVFVSAHPDIITKMGTKEVLVQTRNMSWGSDTHLYATTQELRERLPPRLAEGKPRVLKLSRGQSGSGVWKVEQHPDDPALVRVRHALRGSAPQEMPLSTFVDQCAAHFAGRHRVIDQAYQERLVDGMVRCYLVGDQVAGFGHQAINALYPAPVGEDAAAPPPGPRLYYPPTMLAFQAIKTRMENEWLPELCRTLDIDTSSLPLIWDADFLLGPQNSAGEDTYVLCEINASSVYPFPEEALEPLARATRQKLSAPVHTNNLAGAHSSCASQ